MTVDFLLILLFHAKQDLSRDDAFVRVLELYVRVQGKACGILKQMGGDGLVIHHVLHVVTRLVDPEQRETVEDARVHFLASVCDDAYDDL